MCAWSGKATSSTKYSRIWHIQNGFFFRSSKNFKGNATLLPVTLHVAFLRKLLSIERKEKAIFFMYTWKTWCSLCTDPGAIYEWCTKRPVINYFVKVTNSNTKKWQNIKEHRRLLSLGLAHRTLNAHLSRWYKKSTINTSRSRANMENIYLRRKIDPKTSPSVLVFRWKICVAHNASRWCTLVYVWAGKVIYSLRYVFRCL